MFLETVVQLMQRRLNCHQSCRSKVTDFVWATKYIGEPRGYYRTKLTPQTFTCPAIWSHLKLLGARHRPVKDRFILFLLKFFNNLQHILPKVSESDNSKTTVEISKSQKTLCDLHSANQCCNLDCTGHSSDGKHRECVSLPLAWEMHWQAGG